MLSDTIIRLIAGAVALVGVLLILLSPTVGRDAADAYLRSQGGSMDLTTYQTMLEAYMASYRLLGAVLLGIGAFRALQRPT